ncbi:MAG: preprotein translocase subunit SecG [Phenylobacterium sp. RIFCSPHIGHO2_01_FULL_69_31]|jgi:preprotein translocase subunit SecG|uniref:preprotein translocase subunit SecG n=1 Tax=Phenylobacterium sp. RIFCSPHIGHO2_01_FULL_69_31 TaxID=1801944 RepID=UPI0008C55EA2|nr:preprotein translocase subunit SecG [Phenylobacterium sp. RIFCSPHIGHO2_01_FULL_69_31]OHB28083.1 MAG: preprotein translocase subunit SecG [Phenylobacterium sp. RIFCSPHIGHO2_01_FULL_69_31]
MLLNLLLVIEVIVAFFLVVVVLLQRSEGGGLVSGGTNSLVSVRGAGDLLTRITWILGSIFFILGLLLTIVAGRERGAASVVDRMKVNAVNPADLNREPPQPPAGTAQPGPAGSAPAPLQAPTPTINNPFGTPAATPAAPAPAPAPAQK